MHIPRTTSTLVLGALATACGGRIDIAELESPLSSDTGSQTEYPTPQPDLGGDTPVGPTSPAPPPDLESCYHPGYREIFDPGPAGGMVLLPVPESGCTFVATGDADSCQAQWTCCEDVFTLSYDSGQLGASWPVRVNGGMGSLSPTMESECPLLDHSAAEIAAAQFGYSPEWYRSVADALSAPQAPQHDPLPLNCELVVSSEDLCGATLSCPYHDYYAAFDAEGQLSCAKDGSVVDPVSADTAEAPGACFAYALPADACFGPGWSKYFQLAAEPTE